MIKAVAQIFIAVFCCLCAGQAVAGEPLEPVNKIKVKGHFAAEGKAKDISGIACRPPAGGERLCLVVNDENASAQFATLKKGEIKVEDEQPRIVPNDRTTIIGSAPKPHCGGGVNEADNLDGEGVAFSDDVFYVIGSHGCDRKSSQFTPSAFVLAKFPVDRDGRTGKIERSFRLAEILAKAEPVGPFFGRPLKGGEKGLNIEGIAVVGGDLFVGLRAPSIASKAFLIRTPVASLFDKSATLESQVITLALGERVGVRDLAALDDGRLLVLAGPVLEDPDTPFSIFLYDPSGGEARRLATLADMTNDEGERGKAEAIVVTGKQGNSLRVLILFDSLKDGKPHEYLIPQ